MIKSIFPIADSTIYETTKSLNTGGDAILELEKVGQISGSQLASGSLFNSRILMKFDLSQISSSISSGDITNPKFYLNLYTCEVREVPVSYTLIANPLSQSWIEGIGRSDNSPITTDGVSWKWTTGDIASIQWRTSSFQPNVSGSLSYQSVLGGGVWWTGSSNYISSQSFENQTADVRMDVTNIVMSWISSSIPNHGFIIRRPDILESDSSVQGRLQFFSTNTNTVYVPRLEVAWDDSSFITGSLQALTDDQILIYLKGNRGKYNDQEIVKIRIVGREIYPQRTWATSSAESIVKYLPTSSYYEIRDAHNEHIVVPFDSNFTKLSCDINGNYIKLDMSGLQPERYYRILFKIQNGGVTEIFDNDYVFRVVR